MKTNNLLGCRGLVPLIGICILLLIPFAFALEGNSSTETLRFSSGYITINSTGTNQNIQSFGDYISSLISDTYKGWLSQLDYNFFPPETPELHLPLNNSYFNHTPVFDWSNTTDTEGFSITYLFELYNDSILTEIHYTNYSISETSNTTSESSALINGEGIFYWRLAANDTTKNSTFSTERTITLDTTLPANFNLTSPNGTSSTDTTPELAWEASTDTNLDNYTIELSTEADFSSLNTTEEAATNSFSNWSSSLTQDTYYWRVKAVDKANNQKMSDNNLSFTVEASQTETVVTVTAESSSGGGTKPFTLNIIAPEGVVIYEEDTIKIPLIVINPSGINLKGLNLQVSSDEPNIIPQLDTTYISEIEARQQQKILLSVNSGKLAAGTYGITISATINNPAYKDTFKLFANLLKKDTMASGDTAEKLDFAKQLFNGNPECLDLSEYLTEAELAVQNGQNDKALNLAENAIAACNELINTKKSFDFITTQATLINKVTSTLKSRTFMIIAPQILGLLILTVLIFHFIRRKNK